VLVSLRKGVIFMLGLDSRLVVLLCLIFIGIGIFNITMGRRRQRAAQAQGLRLAWYKQTSVLTGIEYILLSFMFLLSTGISAHWFPVSLNTFVYPLYLAFLFTSAALAGIIIYMVMQDNRRRASMVSQTIESVQNTQQTDTHVQREMTLEEREASLQRRRERRKKAAEARRRRAGKA
jgi:membrane protein implicated in regulation of membrane protease activity